MKYLRGLDAVPLFYESVLISTAAITGLALGFTSLFLMQAVVRRVAGARRAWLFVLGVLALSSFGVYLGRFKRWNSWDVFAQPEAILADLWRAAIDPSDHVRAAALAGLFATFLAVSYIAFYAFARPSRQASMIDSPEALDARAAVIGFVVARSGFSSGSRSLIAVGPTG